jgi:hypothetical protein
MLWKMLTGHVLNCKPIFDITVDMSEL